MDSTSASLLLRLRQPEDDVSWQRFVRLYTPMIYRWACGIGLSRTDAADLVQDVFVNILDTMPSFHYDPDRGFRSWLKTIASNQARDFLRRRAVPPQVSAHPIDFVRAHENGVDFLSVREYNAMLTNRALEIMKSEFEESTWKACWRCVVEGRLTSEVAIELDFSENAVYLAKSRVLRRLRSELMGLWDES